MRGKTMETSDCACEDALDTTSALVGFQKGCLTLNFGWIMADVGGRVDELADR